MSARTASEPGPAPLMREPQRVLDGPVRPVLSFVGPDDPNMDRATVESFGREWERFSAFTDDEITTGGREYFADLISDASLAGVRVLDVGCGSGRWTKYLAERAGFVDAADPSEAAFVAQRATAMLPNVRVVQASVASLPYAPASFDLVVSVGVLHHLPDTAAAIRALAPLVAPGGRLYLYLYYQLEGRALPYRAALTVSHLLRAVVSRLPGPLKIASCEAAAVVVYLPLILLARLVRRAAPGRPLYESIPLHYYMDKPWKVIRNDALDRLGTPIEHRFSRAEIEQMLREAGLARPRFGEHMPRWRVVAERPKDLA